MDSGNGSPSKTDQTSLIEEIDVHKYLVFKKDSEDGPDVKGGQLDALIVHASRVQKISENGKLKSILKKKNTPVFITAALSLME